MAIRIKKKNGVKFDEARAFEVFKILSQYWQNQLGVFQNIILPQDQYPSLEDWNSFFINNRERANWLFCVALTQRGGILSEVPFRLFWWLRQNFPEMFEPKIVVLKWSSQEIKEKLYLGIEKVFNNHNKTGKDRIGYKIDEISRCWYDNFAALNKFWGDDLRNVFWGVTEFEEAYRRINYQKKENKQVGFRGMRRKIFSLLVIWMQEKKIIPVFPTPIPVDIHALRILWATEILTKVDRAKPLDPTQKHPPQLAGKLSIQIGDVFVNQIAKWSQGFIVKYNFSHFDINPALWILSRKLCAEHFQNSSRQGATLYVESDELAKNPYLWPKSYKNPCGYCPIEQYCRWSIPDAPYSRWGLLVRLGRRVPYPAAFLPWLDWKEKVPYISRRNRHF